MGPITYDVSPNKDKTQMGGIREIVESTWDKYTLSKFGSFSQAYDFVQRAYDMGMTWPVLLEKMEEPGTKQKLAADFDLERNDFKYSKLIGHDVVNHIVDDMIVDGGHPFCFLDCIVRGSEKSPDASSLALARGFADACIENGVALLGGETSIQNIVDPDTYILSGALSGAIDRNVMDKDSLMMPGDVLLAIGSNGPHTNGYTLIRKLMDMYPGLLDKEINGTSFRDHIMMPHTTYYPALKDLIGTELITGQTHITGGGLKGNFPRVLGEGLAADIDLSSMMILPLFQEIQKLSNNNQEHMLKTFNCGVGYVVSSPKEHVKQVAEHISQFHTCYPIGEITERESGGAAVNFHGSTGWPERTQ